MPSVHSDLQMMVRNYSGTMESGQKILSNWVQLHWLLTLCLFSTVKLSALPRYITLTTVEGAGWLTLA
jgi:hypothetical protein